MTDATSCPSWERFVNVWRQYHGSNEELDAPYIRNMREEDLQRAIGNMLALMNCEKFYFTNKQ